MTRIISFKKIVGLILFIFFYFTYDIGSDIKPAIKIEDKQEATVLVGSSIKKENLYRVVRTIDGDTIVILKNNKEEKVRLLGVDTPETLDPRKPVQCFGKEASNKTKEILLGKNVRIETDPTQGEYDKYQRLLAYIYLENDELFNKTLIKDGYAHEYTYKLPYKYQKEFKQAEYEARTNKKGLWADGICDLKD